jgi:uncharacterized protein (DUF1778 family)
MARTASQRKPAPLRSKRDTVINVRVAKPMRELIDSAAIAMGKSRSDFIIESAHNRAINVLLDQRFFTLDAADFESFIKTLNRPPAPNQKLKTLFARKSPWEE